MKLGDLKPNKRNPRKISRKQQEALKKSLDKFGDLSGFVYNRRTKQMISGHQKTKISPENSVVTIEKRYDTPTKALTVAEGYVDINGEKFKYREVDAPEDWEIEAMLAANKHGGEWDEDILRLVFADFNDLDLDSTGFTVDELDDLGIELDHEIEEEETDEEYIASHQGPEEEIRKENIDTINREPQENPFDKVEDKKATVLQREYILIIKCKDDDHKSALKDLIKAQVEEAEGKFF